MVLTFPLPLEQFFDGLPIQTGIVDLGEAFQTSETGAGEILSASIGNRLWKLDVEIATRSYAEGAAIKAKLDTLRYPGRSLIARASPMAGPFFDPTGAIIQGVTPKIELIATNNRELTLYDMPVDYVLTAGDFLSYQYGANPVRYALHQVVTGGTVASNGRVTVELSSFMAGGAPDTPVRLRKPVFKATVVPGSVDPGKTGSTRVEGVRFTMMQTFR